MTKMHQLVFWNMVILLVFFGHSCFTG